MTYWLPLYNRLGIAATCVQDAGEKLAEFILQDPVNNSALPSGTIVGGSLVINLDTKAAACHLPGLITVCIFPAGYTVPAAIASASAAKQNEEFIWLFNMPLLKRGDGNTWTLQFKLSTKRSYTQGARIVFYATNSDATTWPNPHEWALACDLYIV